MKNYDTLVEALNSLKAEGYTYDFNLLGDCLSCKDLDQNFGPEEFHVEEVYRFEGASNPDDNSVLYVIRTDSGVKGTLVDAYGAYSEEITPELLAKLKMDRNR